MVPRITRFFDKVYGSLMPQQLERDAPMISDDKTRVLEGVEAARRDWERARSYFDHVTDPDLIDYAIYEIEASERKYMYLLRQARELGYAPGSAPSQSDDVDVETAKINV